MLIILKASKAEISKLGDVTPGEERFFKFYLHVISINIFVAKQRFYLNNI